MDSNDRPLSYLVSQGWEVVGFSSGTDGHHGVSDNFLLRRQKSHKLVKVRRKVLGKGYVVTETDI